MNKLYANAIACFLIFSLFADVAMAQKPLVSAAKKAELDQLTTRLNTTYSSNMQKARQLAPQRNWTARRRTRTGTTIALQRVTPLGFPIFYKTYNNTTAAATTRTNEVQPGGTLGLNLSGSSSFLNGKLAIWDGGLVYAGHQEFAGKVITLKNNTSTDLHATHVAGTMIAKGVYAPAKGMAFNAGTLQSYDFDNDVAEMSAAASSLLLSNHSYGIVAGWNINEDNNNWEWYGLPGDTVDYKFGFYDVDSRDVDQITNNAPYYLPVVASGNSRGYPGPSVGETYYGYRSRTDQTIVNKGPRPANISSNTGYDVVVGFANAKNVLTVGAVNQLPYGPNNQQDISVAYFSSLGPTDDGRIKPDICGDGDALLSTSNSNSTAYTTLSGTSMSAPNVTGSLYLLQEYYAQKNSGSFMRSATLKGLVCHTAFDAGNAGPDYSYGWGILDMHKAAQAITDRNTRSLINENTLQQGQPQSFTVTASGNGVLAATICWTDPQAAVSPDGTINDRTPKLINDLDLRISDGTNTFSPWVLDFNAPGANATRGDNIRDNIEQVYISNAVPGKTYTITISHKRTLQSGSQAYSLIVTGVGGTVYCASAPLSNADSRINNFTLSNINNAAAAGCKSYSDFTGLTAQLEPGGSYPLSITLGTCGSNFNKIAKVFVDWNGDGTFNDADELVATTNVIGGTGTYTTNISVPATITPGNYSLMRVVLVETNNAATISACGSYSKGETQDYRVLFLQASSDIGPVAVSNNSISGGCTGPSNITVRLKNFGTTAASNIPVTVVITPASGPVVTLNEVYTGTLNPGTEDDFTLSGTFNALANTSYALTATTNLSGDLVTSNNRITSSITIGSTPVPSDLSASYCNDSKQYLLNGSGDGQLLWYQASTGGLPVAIGQNAFTTAAPVNNTYYAALNDFKGSVGPATKNVFSGGGYNQFTASVNVSTKIPVIIRSSRLYIGNSGRLTFTATNANGEVVSTSTINVRATRTSPAGGAQTNDPNDQGRVYNINLLLPSAGTYTIGVTYSNGATLYRNNSGVTGYPFKIGDIFSILSNDALSASNLSDTTYYRNFYYFFYDMQVVSAGCASLTRQPVTVVTPVIGQNGATLVSNFATNNQWYLNDVAISGATGQTYVPTQSGNYQLKNVLATGCTAISPVYAYIKQDGAVNSSTDISLSAFPVPASTQLNIALVSPAANDLTISLISTSGRLVYSNKSSVQAGNYTTVLNVSDLAPGTYVLRVLLGQKMYSNKVIIAK